MRKRMISCLLAFCMTAASIAALPAFRAEAEEVEKVMLDWNFKDTQFVAEGGNFSPSGSYHEEYGGQQVEFGKAMNYYYPDSGKATEGMTETMLWELTPMDTNSTRVVQGFHSKENSGLNKDIIKLHNDGKVYLFNSKEAAFDYEGGHRYRFELTVDLSKPDGGSAVVYDVTDGETEVYRASGLTLEYTLLIRFKMNFENLAPGASDTATYIHRFKLAEVSASTIRIDMDDTGILPYCVGDSIPVEALITGTQPEKVELVVDGDVVNTVTETPFTTVWTGASAGEHQIFLRATYAGGSVLETDPTTVTVRNEERVAIHVNDFNDGTLKGGGQNGRTAFETREGAAENDVSFHMESWKDGETLNASHWAYTIDGGLTAENTGGKFEFSFDIIPGEKGTQRGAEMKFAEGGTTLEDLIIFRFKTDGSWAFSSGKKNAQYKENSVYHVSLLIDLENNTYDCQLKEDGVVLYTDTGLTLATKAAAVGKPVTRFKIQQNAEVDGQDCYLDNISVYRYEEIKETIITEQHEMSSPDGRVTGTFLMDSEGSPLYRAAYAGTEVISDSSLGFVLNDEAGGAFNSGFTLEREEPVTVQGSWKPLYGTMSEYPENYTEYVYHLTENAAPNRKLDIIFRMYNEGIAFRYVIPEQEALSGEYTILSEDTAFRIPGNPEVWYQTQTETIPYHQQLSEMGGPTNIRRPMTLLYENGTGAAIVESDMYGFARMHMNKVGSEFRAALASSVAVQAGEGDKHSPWRAMILGDSSGDVLEKSYLVENLAPPASGPEYEDVSWITPGKAVRVANGFSYENACKHVDFAVDRNMQYIMFDGGWYGVESSAEADPRYPVNDAVTGQPLDMKAICDYAHSKGIKVVVYINNRAIFEEYLYNSKNGREEPRYTTEELLQYLSVWGVDGLKPGFVECDTQEAEKWNLDLARLAAKYHMTVNTHDLYVPAGINRTYPNFVGAEGIFGDEHPDETTADRDLTHFFTRYVQGPADHTWCWYNYRVSKTFRLASLVLSYSPQQYLFWYEGPQNYSPSDAKELQFWKDVPVVWDDTKVLEGEIGKYLTIARRSGNDWFIGSGSAVDRELSIPLDFLGDGEYIAEIYKNGEGDYFDVTVADSNDPVSKKTVNGKQDTVVVEKKLVDKNTVLTNEMKYSFGYAVRLTPATPEEIAKLSYVEITAPVNGSTMDPQNVTIQVSVGEGVEKVEFYSDTTLIGTADQAPFSFNWSNPGTGMYSLTAKAYYQNGVIAETETPTVFALSQLSEAAILDLDFDDKIYSGVDISTDTKVFEPKKAEEPNDLAVKLTTTTERAHQVNYTPNPPLSSASETKIRFQADFLFGDNQTRKGLFEIRRSTDSGQQDNPILVNLTDGIMSIKGASQTVPYKANAVYTIKIVLDMQSWLYDCEIKEDGIVIFSQTGLDLGGSGFTKVERVKHQLEATTESGLPESVMYIDNYQVYRTVAAPQVQSITFTDADGNTGTDGTNAPIETKEITLGFSSAMQAASFKDHVTLVAMPGKTPVAFEGRYSGTSYILTLQQALRADTDYRVYFDGVTDTNGIAAVPGYFTSFRTAKEPFGTDSFLCMSGGKYINSMADLRVGDTVSVIPAVRNDTQEAKSFVVIAGVYSSDGAMRCGNSARFTLAPGQTLSAGTIDFTAYDGISASDTLEVYVWDGLRSMIPLCAPVGFEN